MTKIELIQELVVKKESEKQDLYTKREKVEEARKAKFAEMYNKYFKDAIMDGDKIEVSDTYVYFKRFNEDYNYHKEIISLCIKPKSWRDDEADMIETSFYSTNDNSDYELNRMITIGKVGMVILDFKDDIIAEYNSIRSSFKDRMEKANQAVWDMDKKITELNREIIVIENQIALDKLNGDGVEFEVDKENLYKLPSLDVRWNWEVRYIKSIKILSETKSGKSVDIEVETCSNHFDYEVKENVFKTDIRKFERVRRDKVNELVTWNKEKIVKDTSANLVEA